MVGVGLTGVFTVPLCPQHLAVAGDELASTPRPTAPLRSSSQAEACALGLAARVCFPHPEETGPAAPGWLCEHPRGGQVPE